MRLRLFYAIVFILLVTFLFGQAVSFAQTYYVQANDSLYKIAQRYGTSVEILTQVNNLYSPVIYPGQKLQISWTKPTVSNSHYVVKAGDTLYLLAQRYGITIESLKTTNNLTSNYLWIGQQLLIPKGNITTSSGSIYQVKPGDTPYLIAIRNNISLSELLALNNLGKYAFIYPGQILKLPVKTPAATYTSSNHNFSASDLDLLARLVTAEAGGESYQGQVAVAASILNRYEDPRYPNSIYGVVYQISNGRYQFSPVLDGRINNAPSSSAQKAVAAAIGGQDPSYGANGFYNPAKTSNSWVSSQPVTTVIGNHIFFKY